MAEPRFTNEEPAVEHRSTAWVHSSGARRLPVNWCRDEDPWLHNRVEELERQLRLQTIVLAGALALSALLGSFIITSFYKSERPTVAVEMPSSPDILGRSPSVTSKIEQPWQFERSQAWALGEERIEAIATRYYDAQRTRAPTEQLTNTRQDTGEPEALAKEEIRGEGSEAVARDCSPPSPETVVSAFFHQDGSMSTRANERLHYAATDFVNLRAAPDNSAEVLTVVAPGDLMRRTGRDLGWLQVEYGDRSATSIRGWVYSGHLRRIENSGEPARP